MPFTNLETKRAYHRQYMRRRRRVLRERLNPVGFDLGKPFLTDMLQVGGRRQTVAVQGERIYHRSTGALLWIWIDGEWVRA